MNDQYLIESAMSGDADGMRACVCESYRMYVERLGKEPGPMVDDYAHRIKNNDAYVIRANGIIIAILILVIEQSRCLLDNIAVHPSQSGKGLGKKLMDFAEAEAIKKGFDELELYTHELMTENIGMYQKWGYQENHRVTEKGYDRVYMVKSIQ